MNTTKTTKDASIINNNAQISTGKNKFKSVCNIFLLSIVVCAIAFGIGYIVGVDTVKNKKINEIKYTLSSDYELDDWQVLEMAIAKTESEYDPYAIGKTNDIGIFQITPIYVKEANRLSDRHYQHTDAFDIRKSIEMFSIVQTHHNPDYDIMKAINLHNPKGASVNYAERVINNIVFIKRMEAVRKQILLNNFYKSDNIIITEVDKSMSKKDKVKDTIISTLSSTSVEKIKVK